MSDSQRLLVILSDYCQWLLVIMIIGDDEWLLVTVYIEREIKYGLKMRHLSCKNDSIQGVFWIRGLVMSNYSNTCLYTCIRFCCHGIPFLVVDRLWIRCNLHIPRSKFHILVHKAPYRHIWYIYIYTRIFVYVCIWLYYINVHLHVCICVYTYIMQKQHTYIHIQCIGIIYIYIYICLKDICDRFIFKDCSAVLGGPEMCSTMFFSYVIWWSLRT